MNGPFNPNRGSNGAPFGAPPPRTTGMPGAVPAGAGAASAGGAPAMGRPATGPTPNGNGWGRTFQNQYGKPPGQMKPEWNAFRQQNGIGGGAPSPAPSPAPTPSPQPNPEVFNQWRQAIAQWRQQRPSPQQVPGGMPMGGQRPPWGPQMQQWQQQRPDRRTMMANALSGTGG